MIELKEIYNKFHKQVLGVAFHYSGNIQEAEEIMQETFIRLYNTENRPELRDDKHVLRWLLRVAINISFDKFRKVKRFFKLVEGSLTLGEESSQHVSYESKHDAIKLLSKLDEKVRMAIILKYMEEMSYFEISSILKMPEGTIKSLVSRGLKQLSIERGDKDE